MQHAMDYRRVVTACLLIGCCVGLGTYVGRAPLNHHGDTLSVHTIDLGDRIASEIVVEIPVTNASANVLQVTDVVGSCACISISPCEFQVPAGERRVIAATIDLSPTSTSRTLDHSYEFQATISVFAGRSCHSRTTVRARVSNAVEYMSGDSTPPHTAIIGQSDFALTLLVKTSTDRPLDSVDVAGGTATLLGSRNEGVEEIVVQANELVETFGRHTVKITPYVILEKRSFAAHPFYWEFDVCNDARATPSSLEMGRLAMGEKVSETIVVASRSGDPIEVLGIMTSAPWLSVSEPVKDSIGPSYLYHIDVASAALAKQHGSIRFQLRDARGRQFPLELPVAYYGVRAATNTTR